MGRNRPKGGLLGGSDILRLPDTPEVSGTAGADSIDVVFTDPSDVGGGSITSRTASATADGTTTTATGTGTTVTITSLSAATYTVGGFITNDFGNSPDSSTVSVQILFDRAIVAGGTGATNRNTTIDYFAIASTGNASDFGDCASTTSAQNGGMGSTTRGVFSSGTAYSADYQYITFASTGNGTDFGDIQYSPYFPTSFSNETRGIVSGGYYSGASQNNINYFTIASTGNATDFGDLNTKRYTHSGFASSTRGVSACGNNYQGSHNYLNDIEYLTIASTGNGTDFGDATVNRSYIAGTSSSTRGIMAGGYSGSDLNTIDYVTIASTGNATDFGDTSTNRRGMSGANNNLRGVFAGGYGGGNLNEIVYVTIASTGNTSDFGDLITAGLSSCSTSSNHGGLH